MDRFARALDEARKHAAGVAGDAADAAQDVYDSASKAARKTAGSFERALKNTIENQPYTDRRYSARRRMAVGPYASTALTRRTVVPKYPRLVEFQSHFLKTC